MIMNYERRNMKKKKLETINKNYYTHATTLQNTD